MAHLWLLSDFDEWIPSTLVGHAATLAGGVLHCAGDAELTFSSLDADLNTNLRPRLLLQRIDDPPNTWALVAAWPSRVRINGAPMPLGLAVLDDRDEIRLPDFTAWFSTELQAQVEPFPESATRGFCPRCKQSIAAGSPAVRCPICGLWHHQSSDLGCWTYAPTCTACPQDTALDIGFRWTPSDL